MRAENYLLGLTESEIGTCPQILTTLTGKVTQNIGEGKMDDWQPIETAPKDGTSLLLLLHPDSAPEFEGVIEGWWFSSPKEIDDGWETICGFVGDPTHWMPLPAPPNSEP